MESDDKNSNYVILITGTSRGIGRYLAEYYLAKGYFVIGCSRSKVDLDSENYLHFCLDLCNHKELKDLFREIKRKYGRLDILINNAGLSSINYALMLNYENVQDLFKTNVISNIFASTEAVKLMKRNNFGRIVNISSIHVPLASVGTSLYSTTKSSIEHFSRVLSKEISTYGITINNIGLSLVKDTNMVSELSDQAIEEISKNLSLSEFISFEDISYCIDFFISKDAGFITGQTIYTSGV